MSVHAIEKFYDIVAHDGVLLAQLEDGAETRAQFLERAVEMADARGLSFTAGDAEAWLEEQEAIQESGELSDMQLEAVSGGKKKKKKFKEIAAAPIKLIADNNPVNLVSDSVASINLGNPLTSIKDSVNDIASGP